MSSQLVKNATFSGIVIALSFIAGSIYSMFFSSSSLLYTVPVLLFGVLMLVASFWTAAYYDKRHIDTDKCGFIGGMLVLTACLAILALLFSFWLAVGIIAFMLAYLPIGRARRGVMNHE